MPSSLHRARSNAAVLPLPALALAQVLVLVACGGGGPSQPDAAPPLPDPILTITVNGSATGTVTSSPAGISCSTTSTTCSAAFPRGSTVTLSIEDGPAAFFAGWTGGCSGAPTMCTLTLDGDTAITATFDRVPVYPVQIQLAGSGSGRVDAPLDAVRCPSLCSTQVLRGAALSLAAVAAADSQFVGWTVGTGGTACAGTGGCTTTITGPTTITATFARFQTLEVMRTGTGTGTVASTPAGIDCGADCSEPYPPGTAVTLVATPAADSTFVGWSGGCTGSGACTIDFTGAAMVTAEFRLRQYDLTVTRDGTGAGTVTSAPAGIDCGATCTASYDASTAVVLTAAPAIGSTFAGWSGGGCSGTGACTVTITAATDVTATFTLDTHALSVTRDGTGAGTATSAPAGIDCGTNCSAFFSYGASVTLTAAAAAGSTFAGWSGGGCSGTGACTVMIAAATAVTATFTLDAYALSVTRDGTGAGTVTSSPAGIDCGATCSASYDYGTAVTLTATPATGSTFAGWSGGGCSGTGACTVTVAAATDVTATFTLATHALTVAKAGNGSGSSVVTSSPAGINCGTDCSEPFVYGTAVTLTAAPATGATFTGWSGGGCSGTGACTVTVTAATTVTATFTLNQYTLTVIKSGSGGGSVVSLPPGISCGGTCTGTFSHGTIVRLSATPAMFSIFGGWSGGGCSGTGMCNVTMTGPVTVGANFQRPTFTLAVSKTGVGVGTVTGSPGTINCGTSCSQAVLSGTTVTLTATPSANSTFNGWSGGGCTGTAPCTLTVTATTTVTATFFLTATSVPARRELRARGPDQ